MTIQTSLGRRNFLVSSAATAGGLSLGFSFPFEAAHAAEVKEINAWVVIHPDDKVVIRIARSEMGQGTLTGLAQLVAEELQCDWKKVAWEYPSPAENVRRNRVWKNYSTGGSRGIRESNQYVREGGAMAREMLIAAAAAEWKVPANECTAANSVITHPSGKKTTYGAVAAAAAIADTYWNARTAIAALPVEWDFGKLADVQQDTVKAALVEGLGANEAFVGNKVGDAKAAIDGAAKK